MPTRFFLNTRVLAVATEDRTELALSVIKLLQEGFPAITPASLVADLDAAEATYSTYAPATVTAWLAPVGAVGGGYRITAPAVQFALAATPAVPNAIIGYWIELAAGDPVMVELFDEPVAMALAGNSVQVGPTIVYPNGA